MQSLILLILSFGLSLMFKPLGLLSPFLMVAIMFKVINMIRHNIWSRALSNIVPELESSGRLPNSEKFTIKKTSLDWKEYTITKEKEVRGTVFNPSFLNIVKDINVQHLLQSRSNEWIKVSYTLPVFSYMNQKNNTVLSIVKNLEVTPLSRAEAASIQLDHPLKNSVTV